MTKRSSSVQVEFTFSSLHYVDLLLLAIPFPILACLGVSLGGCLVDNHMLTGDVGCRDEECC